MAAVIKILINSTCTYHFYFLFAPDVNKFLMDACMLNILAWAGTQAGSGICEWKFTDSSEQWAHCNEDCRHIFDFIIAQFYCGSFKLCHA